MVNKNVERTYEGSMRALQDNRDTLTKTQERLSLNRPPVELGIPAAQDVHHYNQTSGLLIRMAEALDRGHHRHISSMREVLHDQTGAWLRQDTGFKAGWSITDRPVERHQQQNFSKEPGLGRKAALQTNIHHAQSLITNARSDSGLSADYDRCFKALEADLRDMLTAVKTTARDDEEYEYLLPLVEMAVDRSIERFEQDMGRVSQTKLTSREGRGVIETIIDSIRDAFASIVGKATTAERHTQERDNARTASQSTKSALESIKANQDIHHEIYHDHPNGPR